MRHFAAVLIITMALAAATGGERLSEVHIYSEPSGATVFFDERYVGITPLVVKGVAYGKHLIRLVKGGYKVWVGAIEVENEEVTVKVILQARRLGSISVTSVPPGANVFLNGIFVGKTPIVVRNIEPKVYSLRLEREDFVTWQQEVRVSEDELVNVEAKLESKSEAYLIKEINNNPDDVRAYYELAHLYTIRGRYDDALKILQAGMDACMSPKALTSDMRRLYQEIERIYTGQYKFGDENILKLLRPRILQLLEEGIKRAPRNHYNYTLLAELIDNHQKEIELYESAIKAMKTQRARSYFEVLAASAIYKAAKAALGRGDLQRAISLLEEVVKKYPKAYSSRDALYEIGSIYMDRLRDAKKAIDTLRAFITLYPDDDRCPSVRLRIAEILENSLKDYKGAIEELYLYLNDYPEKDDCPSVHLRIARLYHQAIRDFKAALKEYEAILHKHPEWDGLAGVLKAMGDIWMQLNEPAIAELAYSELLKRFAHSVEAIYIDKDPERRKRRQEAARKYSEAYRCERQNLKEAIERYEAVVKEFTDTYYARSALQRIAYICQYVLKNAEEAIKALNRFIELFPDDDRCEDLMLSIAYVYTSLKQYEKAAEAYRRFIERYPKSDKCVQAQLNLIQLYSIDRNNYDRQRHIEESLKMMRNYPHYDGIPSVWFYLALNFYYRAYPGDKEKTQQELLKLVETYPYCSIRKIAEYYLDLVDEGLQREENMAE